MNIELRSLNQAQRIELWSKRIADCRNSGKSVSAWCEENKVNPKTYYYWQKRIFKQVTACDSAQFIEINAEPIHKIITPTICENTSKSKIVARINCSGIGIDIYSGTDANTISAICQGIQKC